jgi:hypothetical protein
MTLIGLALMAWSILQPTPLPVMLAMTVGQAIGTSAFAIYLVVIVRELRRERAERSTRGRPAEGVGQRATTIDRGKQP